MDERQTNTNEPQTLEGSVTRNDTPALKQDNSQAHDTTVPRRIMNEPIASTERSRNTPFKGYPVKSLQMQERVRKRRELARKAQETK